MKRTTVFLDEDLERELRLVAQRKGVPAAGLLRDALDRYLREERRRPAKPLRFLAAGRSGTGTTAKRHEQLLFKDLKPHGGPPGRRRRTGRKP